MIEMWHDLDLWDVVVIFMVVSAICSAIGTVWNWWTGRRPNAEERIRTAALGLAVASHGAVPGPTSDRCFTARAEVFEEYIREGG